MRSPSNLYHFIAVLLVVLNYNYLKVAQTVILSCFRPLSIAVLVKNGDFARFQLVCDGSTDRRKDTPSYRDARSHLKTRENAVSRPSESAQIQLTRKGKFCLSDSPDISIRARTQLVVSSVKGEKGSWS